ncbi:MAG: uroporphyrinogen decarboxylase family protein [Chlamydiota bacterium]|nr:uroporphyrinogen decarboxylase family protein [Chlamydiota bacterium]
MPKTLPLFLRALAGQNQGHRPPLWVMRQAGRALPPYREIRRQHSLRSLFHSPEQIGRITALPIDLLRFDAALLFADILHVLLPLGVDVDFPERGGLKIHPTIDALTDLQALTPSSVSEAHFYSPLGIEKAKERLGETPLIGFSGGPFTVAHYLTGKKSQRWIYERPEAFNELIAMLTEITAEYISLQVASGVQAIQWFESWGHLLTEEHFVRYVVRPLQQLTSSLPDHIPTIVYSKESGQRISSLLSIGTQGISCDWALPLNRLREQVSPTTVLQGNIDPHLLYAPRGEILRQVHLLMERMEGDPAWICNLGHGVLPDTPYASLEALVQAVQGRR